MTRLALVSALVAAVLSGAALAVALGSTPPASPWPLTCQQEFTSAQGQSYPVYYPCSAVKP
jgi:hypothetical protein